MGWFGATFKRTVLAKLNLLIEQGETIMAASDDLKTAVANIQADETALGTAIANVQTLVAGLQTGSVTAADVETAVSALATAHTAFQANVATLAAL